MCWIGGDVGTSNTSQFNNCIVSNCTFIKDKIDYAAIKFGYQGTTDSNNCNNFIMDNCILKAKSGSGSLLFCNKYAKNIIIQNCKIEIESEVENFQYGFISIGNYKYKNCEFDVKHEFSGGSTAFYNISDGIYNCNLKLNGGRVFNGSITKIYNSIIKGAYILFYAQDIANDIDLSIINCDIEVTNQLITRIGITTNSNILIKDCNIKQSDEPVIYLYSVTGNKNTRIINTNFENSTLLLTNASSEVLTISNCTKQGLQLSGIPSTSEVRSSCVIGTIFDGGPGHSVVRKISDGNQTTNWETI